MMRRLQLQSSGFWGTRGGGRKGQNVSNSEMAKWMHTSRAALDRLLDPENDAATLSTLHKAVAVGRGIRLKLV